MGQGKTKREVIDVVRRTVKKKKEKEGKDFEKFKFNVRGVVAWICTKASKIVFTYC